jgi:hypothetical protein
VNDGGVHPHPMPSDVFVHQRNVADVTATVGQRMQLQVGTRPPLLIAVVCAVEQDVGELCR